MRDFMLILHKYKSRERNNSAQYFHYVNSMNSNKVTRVRDPFEPGFVTAQGIPINQTVL